MAEGQLHVDAYQLAELGKFLLSRGSLPGQLFPLVTRVIRSKEQYAVRLYLDQQGRPALLFAESPTLADLKELAVETEHELLHYLLGHPLHYLRGTAVLAFHLAVEVQVALYLPAFAKKLDQVSTTILTGVTTDTPLTELQQNIEAIPQQQWQATARAMERRHQSWTAGKPIRRELATIQLPRLIRGLLTSNSTEDPGNPLLRTLRQLRGRASALPWQQLLRRQVLTSNRSQLRSTRHRPSRRYPSYPGHRVESQQRLVVVLDTSASVSPPVLEAFVLELEAMQQQGFSIYLIEADTRVRACYVFRGQRSLRLRGGGGTSFEPALRYAQQLLRPDLLLYCTDGVGPEPLEDFHFSVIWLISGRQDNPRLRGKKIYLHAD